MVRYAVIADDVREALTALETTLNAHPKNKPLNEDGHEILDPRPLAPPVGYVKQPSMVEHIRTLVKSELLRQAAETAEADTFEEADDFDVEDDDIPEDPHTPYEAVFDPPATTLPDDLPEVDVRAPEPPETAPQAQGTHPEDGEEAPTPPPAPRRVAQKGSPSPRPPIPPKRA